MKKAAALWFGILVYVHVYVIVPLANAQVNGREYSASSSEARKRGTLISEVTIAPSSFKWKNVEVTIGQAWIEKCKDGGCYLCFRIEKGQEACYSWRQHSGMFVVGDEGSSVLMHAFRDSRLLAVQYLESLELKDVRLSFVANWKDERLKNFRVARVPPK